MSDLQATGLCPVCRCGIETLGAPAVEVSAGEAAAALPIQCVRCATWYHQDCWDYGGGCSIFGCAPAAPKPCPAPRPSAPLWERVTDFGVSLATQWAAFLVGTLLGLLLWWGGGFIMLPVLFVFAAGGAQSSPQAHGRALRCGIVLGPILLFLLPRPEVFGGPLAVGVGAALLGAVMRAAQARPHVSSALALVVLGTLGWSHAPDQVPVPFTVQRTVPQWAVAITKHGAGPRIFEGDDLGDCWAAGRHLISLSQDARGTYLSERCSYCLVIKSALMANPPRQAYEVVPDLRAVPHNTVCPHSSRLPEEARVLVLPRGAERIQVARVHHRIRVTYVAPIAPRRPVYGTAPRWRTNDAAAVVLPAGNDPIEIVEVDTLHRVLGPRLDDLVRAPARRVSPWPTRSLWNYVAGEYD